MTIFKKLSLGLVAATMLATPAMAQAVYQEPGMIGFNYPNSSYTTGGYVAPGPGYYYGNRFQPVPRVGAFATAPWTDGGSYYGYVDRY
jgi:opacity protein-like surface antigen